MSDRELRELERRWRETRDPEQGAAWARALERSGAAPHRVLRVQAELEDADDYLAEVAALPRPTAQQIADYACFVSECHSWYKHIPLAPPTPFVFFLSPWPDDYAGSGHYAAHGPVFHFEHFGHFEYRSVREGRPPPSPSTRRGQPLVVPPTLLRAGTALVTSLMHPLTHPRYGAVRDSPEWSGLAAYEAELLRTARTEGVGSRLRLALGVPSEGDVRAVWEEHLQGARPRLLGAMQEAMHAVADVVYGPEPTRERPAGRPPWFHHEVQRRPGQPPVQRIPPPPRPGDDDA